RRCAGDRRSGFAARRRRYGRVSSDSISLAPFGGEGRGEGGLETALRSATAQLRQAGIESPRLEARLLLAHALSATQEALTASRVALDAEAQGRFAILLDRRLKHEPIAYITGRREFWSLSFAVDNSVLIPRPESETLIEAALRRFPDKHAPLTALDLGTG